MILALFMYSSQAQESSKFKFHSVSVGIGSFTSLTDSFYGDLNGLNFNADLAFDLDDYLFSVYVGIGTGLKSLIVVDESYSEFNLTIGKEFRFNNWLAVEGHFGIGYFSYKYQYSIDDPVSEGTLGFPLRIKSNFYLNDHWVLGLNPNFNINTYYSVILSGCLIVQYVF